MAKCNRRRSSARDDRRPRRSREETELRQLSALDSERRAWRALWAVLVGFFMIMVDSTVVSVATSSISTSLHAGVNGVLWVTSAYLLAFTVPLLIFGRLGDRFGPRRTYLVGLTVF